MHVRQLRRSVTTSSRRALWVSESTLTEQHVRLLSVGQHVKTSIASIPADAKVVTDIMRKGHGGRPEAGECWLVTRTASRNRMRSASQPLINTMQGRAKSSTRSVHNADDSRLGDPVD